MTLDYFYGQAGELFSFFRISKALFQEQRFQDLSTDAKTLYGILLDRMSLSVKNEWSNTTEVIDFLCLSVIPFVTRPTALLSSPMVETPALKEFFRKTQRGDHF